MIKTDYQTFERIWIDLDKRRYSSFEKSVNAFLEKADWLTHEDAPMVASLVIMARQLDQRFSAATMAQFGLSYRYLAKKAPASEGVEDPLEALLDNE